MPREETGSSIPVIDAFVGRLGPHIIYREADYAFYDPNGDFISISPRDAFDDPQRFYAALLHECAHWTGYRTRLNRTYGLVYGDRAYCLEEITAITAEMHLCHAFDIGPTGERSGLDYATRWLPELCHDAAALAGAIHAGERAVRYLFRRAGGRLRFTGSLHRSVSTLIAAHFSTNAAPHSAV